jgi:hypothetical protein
MTYNPELAPLEILFQQAEAYDGLPPDQLQTVRHHLQETKVVLIKAMISDELEFVRIAKEYLSVDDLRWIRTHRVGRGKIGGKAAGLVLAWKIVQQTFANRQDGTESVDVVIPPSYFVAADVMYDFLALNRLLEYLNQKYKPLDQIERDYPEIQAAYAPGHFPEDILAIRRAGGVDTAPIAPSSLLEDN